VKTYIMVFRFMTPFILVGRYQRFGGACHICSKMEDKMQPVCLRLALIPTYRST